MADLTTGGGEHAGLISDAAEQAEVGLYTLVLVVVALTCAGCERRRRLLDSHLIWLVLLFVFIIHDLR